MAPLCVQSLHSFVSFSLVYFGVMFLAAFRLNNILSSYWKETSVTHQVTHSPVKLGVVRSTLLEGLCGVCGVFAQPIVLRDYLPFPQEEPKAQLVSSEANSVTSLSAKSSPHLSPGGSQGKWLWRIPQSPSSQLFSQSLNLCSLNFLR